jgi:hypothetical protein
MLICATKPYTVDTQFCGVHQQNRPVEHRDLICSVCQLIVCNFHRCAVWQQNNALPAQFRFPFVPLIVHLGYEGEC